MDLNIRKGDLTLEKCDALIINFFVGDKNLGGATGAVDKALGGLLGRILKEEHFAGKEGDVCYIRPAKFSAKWIFVVGLGERKDFCEETVRNVAAEYRVNPITVLKGYQQLVDEQLVETKRGRGMFINAGARNLLLEGERQKFLEEQWPRIHATIQRLGLTPEELLDAATATPPSPDVAEEG